MVPTRGSAKRETDRRKTSHTSIVQLSLRLCGLILLSVGLTLGIWFFLWALRPILLPQDVYYDLVANRGVTERLVDPALLKVEQWEILDEGRDVLFVHPAPSGSTALVYPVKIEPATTFQADLAVAPEAWTLEGDGTWSRVTPEEGINTH